jgi:hypothetical protein
MTILLYEATTTELAEANIELVGFGHRSRAFAWWLENFFAGYRNVVSGLVRKRANG